MIVFKNSDGDTFQFVETGVDCSHCAFINDTTCCIKSKEEKDCVNPNGIWIPMIPPEASKTISEAISEGSQGVGSQEASEGTYKPLNLKESGVGLNIGIASPESIGVIKANLPQGSDMFVLTKGTLSSDFTVNEKGGMKHEVGKLQPSLLLQDCKSSVEEVIRVLQYGSQKYSRKNWALVTPEQYKEALLRHVLQFVGGETNDPESGFHHLAHAVCCALFIQELSK